jgi:hypothetical protein
MANPHKLEFCYILTLPFNPVVDLGQAITAPVPKDAPYFFELNIQFRKLQPVQKQIGQVPIRVLAQVLNNEVWIAECYYTLSGPLDDAALQLKHTINAALRKDFLKEVQYQGVLVEEYTLLLVSAFQGAPDDFVNANSVILARLLRESDRIHDAQQVQRILQSRARYGVEDLTIVDWEGALVLSPQADFQTEIDLLKIGNYHLLKYRLVDDQIDAQLKQLRVLVGRSFSWFSNRRETLQKIVDSRLSLLLDFENTDQSILLIGDWYSAELYRIIFDEFYIDEWKAILSDKLETLSSIAEVVQQNLTLSWRRLLDLIQVIGWLIILTGYMILFLKDAKVIP